MIRSLARLFRLRLALLNGVAAAGGALLFPVSIDTTMLAALFCGVSLLAAGGSALNQVLERRLDRLMERTRLRPVASGELQPKSAAVIGSIAVSGGAALIAASGGLLPAAVGFAGILWYLAVYTPMKRHTPYALAIGALCGALPPVVGWCSSGGQVTDFPVLLLSVLLYIWQIPHFWLFQRRYAAEYRAAGFPLLEDVTRLSGISGLFTLWMVSLISAAMLLPAFGMIPHSAALWIVLFPLPLFAIARYHSERMAFSYLNVFPLLITLGIVAGRYQL